MGAGRFLCVGIPFALTIASLVFLLIANLGSLADSSFYMFKVETKDLSISPSDIKNFENLISKRGHFSELTTAALSGYAAQSAPTSDNDKATANANQNANITAADLGLADSYQVSMWRLCSTTGSNTNCTAVKFNWARSELNITQLSTLVSKTGQDITLPKSLTDSLNTFSTAIKWTEIVYIIAAVVLAIELVVGLFGFCSRVGSCFTSIINGFSTTAVIAASVLSTVISAVTVGAINGVSKAYNAHASLQTRFLVVTWIAAAFSIAAGLFWLFSMCCCAADHHRRSSNRQSHSDGEKLLPNRGSGYQRVEDPHGFDANTAYGPQTEGLYNYQHPVGRQSAYEPYTHAAV